MIAACDLRLLKGAATWQGADASLAGSIRLTNPGPAPCRLLGSAQLTLIGKDGQSLAVQPAIQPADLTLTAGRTAQAAFLWRNFCAPAPEGSPILSLSLPDPTSRLQLTSLGPDGAPLSSTPPCSSSSDPSTLQLKPFTIQ